MAKQKPAKRDIAPYKIDWILASLAGLLLLLAYFPRHPLQAARESLGRIKRKLQFR